MMLKSQIFHISMRLVRSALNFVHLNRKIKNRLKKYIVFVFMNRNQFQATRCDEL